jgi:hypothetical protein
MKSHLFLSLATLGTLLLMPPSDAFAQEEESSPITFGPQRAPLMIGPTIGASMNFHSGGFRTIAADENCPEYGSGTGVGFIIGASAELSIAEKSSLIPRLLFETRPGSFEQDLPPAYVPVPGSDQPVPQTVRAAAEVSYSLLNLEVLFKQELMQFGTMRVGVAAGPSFGFVVGGDLKQMQDLLTPENARFSNPNNYPLENDGRRLVFYDGEIPSKSGTRFSLKLGVQSEIGLFGNSWFMSPGLFYDIGLSDVTEGENWQVSSLMLTVDFRRAF